MIAVQFDDDDDDDDDDLNSLSIESYHKRSLISCFVAYIFSFPHSLGINSGIWATYFTNLVICWFLSTLLP